MSNSTTNVNEGPPRSALRFLAPGILCFFAASQAYIVHTRALTRWKGAGFGMFSTIDDSARRSLRVELLTAEGPHLADLKQLRISSAGFDQARALPSQERLQWVARTVAGTRWMLATSPPPPAPALPPTTPEPRKAAIPWSGAAGKSSPALMVQAVRVQVRSFGFDPRSRTVFPRTVGDLTWKVPGYPSLAQRR